MVIIAQKASLVNRENANFFASLRDGECCIQNRFFSCRARPCAAITSVFAVQYHYDEELAAGAVVASTLLSILILPAFALLVQTIG